MQHSYDSSNWRRSHSIQILRKLCCVNLKFCRFLPTVLLLIILTVFSVVFLTEWVPFGMKRLNFRNYYTISWFSVSSFVIVLPVIIIMEVSRYCFKKREDERQEHLSTNQIMEENENKFLETYEEYSKPVSHIKLFTFSFLFAIISLLLDYFTYLSLSLIPPSMNLIIFSSDSIITLCISVFLLWNQTKTNLIPKFMICTFAVSGIVLIAFGSEDPDNKLSEYPHIVIGILVALIGVFLSSLEVNLFLVFFGDLSFLEMMYFGLYTGLLCILFLWIPIPIFHFIGNEPITLSVISNPSIWGFLCITGSVTVFYDYVLSFLVLYIRSPVLVVILCMLLEAGLSLIYDHIVLGVSYSAVVWIGVFMVLCSVVALNLVELMPYDVLFMGLKFWCGCCFSMMKYFLNCSFLKEDVNVEDEESKRPLKEEEQDEEMVVVSLRDVFINEEKLKQ